MRVIEESKTPWFRSASKFLAFVVKWSVSSGTFRTTRRAQRAACKKKLKLIPRRVIQIANLFPDVSVGRSKELLNLVG